MTQEHDQRVKCGEQSNHDRYCFFVDIAVDSLQLNIYASGGGGNGGVEEHCLPVGTPTGTQLGHAHSPLALPTAAVLNRQTTLT